MLPSWASALIPEGEDRESLSQKPSIQAQALIRAVQALLREGLRSELRKFLGSLQGLGTKISAPAPVPTSPWV